MKSVGFNRINPPSKTEKIPKKERIRPIDLPKPDRRNSEIPSDKIRSPARKAKKIKACFAKNKRNNPEMIIPAGKR